MSSKIISAIALALPLSHAMPSISPDNGKIVGGELAETGEFPFLVSLQGPGLCGGGLLDAQTIITAAHCFEPDTNTPEEFQARAGSNFQSEGGQLIGIKSVVNHPEYDPETKANDVAIWKLVEPFSPSEFISFVTLPEPDFDPAPDSLITIAGWGHTSSGGETSEDLLKVSVPIVDREACAAKYGENDSIIDESMFCGGYPEGGRDTCQGDSGGPVINEEGTLVGVVSWGNGCALPEWPGVYTRVSIMLDFVIKNWKPHCRV